MHLAEVQIVVGEQGQDGAVAVDAGLAALEVVALLDLAEDALDGVLDFCQIGPGDDIEGGQEQPLVSV